MATKFYGDQPRSRFVDLAEQEALKLAEYTKQAERESDRRRMFAGEYDSMIPNLTDADAAKVEQGAAIGSLEVPATIASSVVADIPAGFAGLMAPSAGRDPVAAVEGVQDRFTYMPRSKEGRDALMSLGSAIQELMTPVTAAADAVTQAGADAGLPPWVTAVPLAGITAAGEAVPGGRAEKASGRFVRLAEKASDSIDADFANTVLKHDPQAGARAGALQDLPEERWNEAIPEFEEPRGMPLEDQVNLADMPVGSMRERGADSFLDRVAREQKTAANPGQAINLAGKDFPDEATHLGLASSRDPAVREAMADMSNPQNRAYLESVMAKELPYGKTNHSRKQPPDPKKPKEDWSVDEWREAGRWDGQTAESGKSMTEAPPIDGKRERAYWEGVREGAQDIGNSKTISSANRQLHQLDQPIEGEVSRPLLGNPRERGSVEDTGAGARVLGAQAGRNIITNTAGILGPDGQPLNALNMDASRVAQRYPNAVKSTENALNDPELRVAIDAMHPANVETAINAMRQYPQYRLLPADPYEAAGKVTQLHRRNLEWLMENVPKEVLDRSSKWYEGAQKISFDLGKAYGVSSEQAAGVLAVMSPKTEWFTNVSSAERIIETVQNGKNLKWSKQMDERLSDFGPRIGDKRFAAQVDSIRGKNYADLETVEQKALWIRAYDEAHNPRSFANISPEGEKLGNALNQGGKEKSFGGWGVGMGPIAKAVEILENGDLKNISRLLGENHKIRNFYNNIIAPHSNKGDVTIDTHAVAANTLQPFGQSSLQVAHAFGSSLPGIPGAGGSKITGIQGTYPIHAEPYRQLGNALNVPARAVQSMTWEAVRGLFTNKSAKVKADAERIWKEYAAGRISEGEARDKIMELAGGIDLPVWAK